jgi:hypothetical protein
MLGVRLKAHKGFAYFCNTAELQCCVADGPVSQFKKMRQLAWSSSPTPPLTYREPVLAMPTPHNTRLRACVMRLRTLLL